MKILYIIDTLEGYGAEKSIVEIAMNFKETTPIFVHLYPGNKLVPILQKAGIKVYSLNIQAKFGYSTAVKLLVPIIEEESPQIIHSTLFRADMVARKLKNKFAQTLLVGSFVSNSYSKLRYCGLPLYSKFNILRVLLKDRLSAAKVDFFISNSNAILESNLKVLNISKNRTEVIYRGRYFQNFKIIENSANLKSELNLGREKVFINVARLHYGKGLQDLLVAFYRLKQEHPNVILLLVGEGKLRSWLEFEVKNLRLEKNVYLLGYREDIPQLLNVADFFVFPSYYEGLPGALIEATIAKKPVIASDIPENRECLAKGSALFFPPGNVTQLKLQMQKALTTNNWEEMTEKAYVHAKKNFEISQISEKYEKFYKKILDIPKG